MRASRYLLSLMIFSAGSVSAKNIACENALKADSTYHKESVQVLFINRTANLPGGGHIEAGHYRLEFTNNQVTDLDGVVAAGRSFASFRDMMSTVSPVLANPHDSFYRSVHFRSSENSPRMQAVRFLFLEDYKRAHNWATLSFVPTDETALFTQTKQTKALFKRLKILRDKYALELVPEELQVASPQHILEFYRSAYVEAITDVESLKIQNVENPSEAVANKLLSGLQEELVQISQNTEAKFVEHFIEHAGNPRLIDMYSLSLTDYKRINEMRTHLRASLTETFVALRVPQLLGVNMTLQQAFEEGVFTANEAVIEELMRAGVYCREFDVLTANGVFEIKSAMTPDFIANKDDAGQSTGSSFRQASDCGSVFRGGKNAVRGFDPASPSQRKSLEGVRKIQNQELARGIAIEILKRHGVVSQNFESAMIYADGKLKQDLKTHDPAFGVVDLDTL